MHLRKLRVQQTCKKYGDALRAPELVGKKNTLIWDLRDGLIYCRIAKVGKYCVKCIRAKIRKSANLNISCWRRRKKEDFTQQSWEFLGWHPALSIGNAPRNPNF